MSAAFQNPPPHLAKLALLSSTESKNQNVNLPKVSMLTTGYSNISGWLYSLGLRLCSTSMPLLKFWESFITVRA